MTFLTASPFLINNRHLGISLKSGGRDVQELLEYRWRAKDRRHPANLDCEPGKASPNSSGASIPDSRSMHKNALSDSQNEAAA